MAHFAEINENNVVLRVIFIDNSDCLSASGDEWDAIGALYCKNLLGGNWIGTSYNNNSTRKNYASPGATYDEALNAFIEPSPFLSWIFDKTIYGYVAPVAYPSDGFIHRWNENRQSWARR